MRKAAFRHKARRHETEAELMLGVRSLHIRHVRGGDPDGKVRRPVHVLYYRVAGPGVIEILRVLHERMEPSRHVG